MKKLQRTTLASVAAGALLMMGAVAHPALASATPPPLGQPDAITFVVPDVQAAQQQLEQGTGAVFTQLQRTLNMKVAGESDTQHLTLTEAVYAPTQGAAVELVQISSAESGTWGGDGRAHVALSYAVESVYQYVPVLKGAGLQQVAVGDGMAVWQGTGGVTIRLDEHLPTSTPPSSSAAPIDLGAPVSIALYPCDPLAVAQQLTRALGLNWRDSQTYQLPWTLADGSSVSPSSTSTTSQNGQPYVTVANSHGFPGEDTCTTDYLSSYLIYATSDVSAADTQLASAGLQFIGAVPTMITLYIGAGRVPVQVVHTSFTPQ